MVDPLVKAYIESEFAKLNSKNKLTLEDLHGGKPWVADYKHWNYEAAKKATEVRSVTLSTAFIFTLSDVYLGRIPSNTRPHSRGWFDPCDAHLCRNPRR
jgi:hypothetical protein